MARLRSNFQRGSLSSNISNTDTSLSSGEFSALPVVASPDYLMIVLDPDAVHGNPEIVKVTAHTSSATTVTVARAQESTSARSHNSSTTWRHIPTKTDWDNVATVFSLKDYGATGDGSTDDTTAIQNCVNDAMSSGGRAIMHAPYPAANYRCTSTITFTGADPLWIEGSTGPDSTSTFRRDFDGPLFQIERSVGGRNFMLYDSSTSAGRSGAAFYLTATGSTRRAQYLFFENVRVTSTDAAGAWERIVHANGTAWSGGGGAGIRNVVWISPYFFGCRTAGETILIDSSTNWYILGGQVNADPTAVTQGIKILSNTSDGIHIVAFHNGGNFSSEGNNVSYVGGEISGNATLTSAATNSYIDSIITGTITQSSSTNCTIRSPRNVYGQQTFWNATSSAAVLAARTVGDSSDRWRLRADGLMFFGNGAGTLDVNLYRQGAGVLRSDQKLVSNTGLGAGNSAAASSLGSVVKKLQIFDSAGNSLGYLPIYDAIT